MRERSASREETSNGSPGFTSDWLTVESIRAVASEGKPL